MKKILIIALIAPAILFVPFYLHSVQEPPDSEEYRVYPTWSWEKFVTDLERFYEPCMGTLDFNCIIKI